MANYDGYELGSLGYPLDYGEPWKDYGLEMSWFDDHLCDNYDKYPVSEGYPQTIEWCGITFTQMSGQRYSTEISGNTVMVDLTFWDNTEYYTLITNPPTDYLQNFTFSMFYGSDSTYVMELGVPSSALQQTSDIKWGVYYYNNVAASTSEKELSLMIYAGSTTIRRSANYYLQSRARTYIETLIDKGFLIQNSDHIYWYDFNIPTTGNYIRYTGATSTSDYVNVTIPYIDYEAPEYILKTYYFNWHLEGELVGESIAVINPESYATKTVSVKLLEDLKTVKCTIAGTDILVATYTYPTPIVENSLTPTTFTISDDDEPEDVDFNAEPLQQTVDYTVTYHINWYLNSVLQQGNVTYYRMPLDEYGGKSAKASINGTTVTYKINGDNIFVWNYGQAIDSVTPQTITFPNNTSSVEKTINIYATSKSITPTPSSKVIATVYTNSAEPSRVDKTGYLTEQGKYELTLKATTNVTNPTLILELDTPPTFNYLYITCFDRYYYVTNVTVIQKNIWKIDCSCDVLMSYKVNILNLTAHVDRNEQFRDPLIPDTERAISCGQEVYEFGFTVPSDRPNISISPSSAKSTDGYCMVVNGYRLTVKELS